MTLFHQGARRLAAPSRGLCLGAALLALGLAGCATSSAARRLGLAPSSPAERGRAIAERDCARCHGLGLAGGSPRAAAPPFRELGRRYNPLTFQRRMAEAGGHEEMPDPKLSAFDLDAIAAYISAL